MLGAVIRESIIRTAGLGEDTSGIIQPPQTSVPPKFGLYHVRSLRTQRLICGEAESIGKEAAADRIAPHDRFA